MDTLLSPVWDMVAGLRPSLAPRTKLNRQYFRGQVWYILQDPTTARFHRLSPIAHYVVSNMDGRRTLAEIWDLSLERWGDAAPGQTDVIGLVAKLFQQDLLMCDMSIDVQNLLYRTERRQRLTRRQKFMSPLSIRLPLLDPDKFLDHTSGWVDAVFNRWGLVLWFIIVSSGLVLAGVHWEELTGNLADRVFSPGNLVVMLLIYPVVKLFHELGHAYAVKRWGGEVHDIGVLFLVFMPVPYVDASAASAFRDKRERMIVGASGIMVELALASLAMWLWTETQPGLLRAIAFNVMLIGGVSTLFFNGNPLLRFDGYYVFSDAIEIPNLGTRSTQYLGYLVQKYLLRSQAAEQPLATTGERLWFVAYGISAFIYRMIIMVTIIVFVASQWFFIGVLLAIWALNAMLVMPVWRKLRFLASSQVFRENRAQAVSISLAVIGVLTCLFVLIPIPSYTTAEGVVWVPESAEIRAAGDGVLQSIEVQSGDQVAAGETLFLLEDPLLLSRIRVLQSRLSELDARFQSQLRDDPGQAQITRSQRDTVAAQLKRSEEKLAAQRVVSPNEGTFLVYDPVGMAGRFYRQGDLLAYVVSYPVSRVVAVVQQDHIGQVRRYIESVELRLASNVDEVFPASILREIPASTQTLPSSALGEQGGGRIAIDPAAQKPTAAFEPFFQFEIALPKDMDTKNLGERVYVRFRHANESLAVQLWRIGRRAFLKRFDA